MYIHIHKNRNTNKHTHTHNSLSQLETQQLTHIHKAHLHKKTNTKCGYHIHYLLPQMKRIWLMYATVRGGTVCNWKRNIKHSSNGMSMRLFTYKKVA